MVRRRYNPLGKDCIRSQRVYSPQGEMRREMQAEFLPDTLDEEARTVELSFSSELPVEVWPGEFEILSHDPSAADFSRLNDGGALLFNHDRSAHIGVFERAWIDPTARKGRGKVRFSNSQLGQEKFQDVKDGILTKTSVGYRVIAWTEAKREDGTMLYTVTKWIANEGSLVTIPADTSTGVDRAANDNSENEMNINNRYNRRFMNANTGGGSGGGGGNPPPANPNPPATQEQQPGGGGGIVVVAEQERQAGGVAERTRITGIRTACKQYDTPDLEERAINEGWDMNRLREEVLKVVNDRNEGIRQGTLPIGLSKKEKRRFSFVNLLRAISDPTNPAEQRLASFELEVCRAGAEAMKYRQTQSAFAIPSDILCEPLMGEDYTRSQRDNVISILAGAGYTGTGGQVVATTLLASSFIEILRNALVFMKLGFEMTGLVGDFNIPKMTSSQFGGGWIGEDDPAPNTQVDFGLIPLRPHTAAAYSAITRKMLMQPSIGVEALVRYDILLKLAQLADYAGWYGDGSNNMPTGLKATTGIHAVPFTGANPTYAEIVEMETRIALDNAAVANMAYVANARFRGYAKTNLKFPLTVNGAGQVTQMAQAGTIWEPGDMVNGYGCEITNQVTTGDVFFGNFRDAVIGMWGGLEIIADPYTKSTQGQIRISAFQDFDFAFRRVASFCYGAQTAGNV